MVATEPSRGSTGGGGAGGRGGGDELPSSTWVMMARIRLSMLWLSRSWSVSSAARLNAEQRRSERPAGTPRGRTTTRGDSRPCSESRRSSADSRRPELGPPAVCQGSGGGEQLGAADVSGLISMCCWPAGWEDTAEPPRSSSTVDRVGAARLGETPVLQTLRPRAQRS